MVGSLRTHVGFSAVVLLGLAGLLAPLSRSAAGSDNGLFDGLNSGSSDNSWEGDGGSGSSGVASAISADNADNDPGLFNLRVNALFLNRTSGPNVALAQSATGTTLFSTSQNDPGWAMGEEFDFMLNILESTNFELNFFSIEDWFNNRIVGLGGTIVDQVGFPVAIAGSSVSSQLRNFELNLREQLSETFTILGGFRYVSFLDSQGVHFGNTALGFSEDISTGATNRLFGFQIGGQAALLKSDCWQLDGWLKAGIYGNSAIQGTDVAAAGIPQQAVSFRAVSSRTAFVGDLGVRGTRQFNKYFSAFAGYRLMFLDGVALAGKQYPGVIQSLHGGAPTIAVGNSVLFQGLEVGLTLVY